MFYIIYVVILVFRKIVKYFILVNALIARNRFLFILTNTQSVSLILETNPYERLCKPDTLGVLKFSKF